MLNGEPVPLDELIPKLRAIRDNDPTANCVAFLPDRLVTYAKTEKVMKLFQGQGFDLGLRGNVSKE
jgi:biopolymer transport protein ExbD